MKLSTIINSNFTNAMSKIIRNDLPIKTAFKLKKIVSKLNEETARYNEVRQEYIKRYAELDSSGEVISENGIAVFKDEESKNKFYSDLQDLLNMNIEVDKLSINELGNISVSAADLLALEDLLAD